MTAAAEWGLPALLIASVFPCPPEEHRNHDPDPDCADN
jgi:hypothetical protein